MHRLSLSFDGSRVVAQLDLGFCIGLLQLEGIRGALPMRQRQPNKVLQKVHELGHGQHCNLATCVVAKPALQATRTGLLVQYVHLLQSKACREISLSAVRKANTAIVFNFSLGSATLREETSLAPSSHGPAHPGDQPGAGRDHHQPRADRGTNGSSARGPRLGEDAAGSKAATVAPIIPPNTEGRDRSSSHHSLPNPPPPPPPPPITTLPAVRLKLRMYRAADENQTIDELCGLVGEGGAVELSQGQAGREAARPSSRMSAEAGAAARVAQEAALESAVADAEADERERRLSHQLALQLQAKEEEKAAWKRVAGELEEAREAEAVKAAQQLARLKTTSSAALAKARGDAREWRDHAANAEEALIDARRQPDAAVRSSNEAAMAARAAAEQQAALKEAENAKLVKENHRFRAALVRERANRKAVDGMLFEEREQHERESTDALRRQDEEMRATNVHRMEAERAALQWVAELGQRVEQLSTQLDRARQLRGSGSLELVQQLEHELSGSQEQLAKVHSTNATLRRSTDASEVTKLRTQLRAAQTSAKDDHARVQHHEQHLLELQENEERLQAEEAAERLVARRAADARAHALRRARCAASDAKEEVAQLKLTVSSHNATLRTMTIELARCEAAALERQATADARFDDLCARLQAGDARTKQVQQELEALIERTDAAAKDSARKHAIVLEKLAASEAACGAYANFQAMEGGAYKDSVRECYYSLIDKKVPTNQIHAVVTDVLKMLGVHAKNLPKRTSSQNMRREMGHVADVVAGVLLAKAENATGASDDTTKRQRTLAADLVHFRLTDGSLRTLCIGLSCMSSGTAAAKVDRYAEKMAQVQAAARLSVPSFHGDVTAFDRVTLLDLIKNWCSDRAITERNAAKLVEERKAKEARAREGARQLVELRSAGITLKLSVSADGVGATIEPVAAGMSAQLLRLEREALDTIMASMERLPHASYQQLKDAECARLLGESWWGQMMPTEQRAISRCWAATCNAHRWVNVGKGFDEGIKAAFDEIKAAKRGPDEAAMAPTKAKDGSPWDRLIYEATKMLCMNARKMNVAIGQDLLGQQMIELGKDPEACIHTKLKVIVGERFLVTYTNALPVVAMESELVKEGERLSDLMEVRRIRKSGDKSHNRLEQSVLEHYKDHDEYDALRVKAIVGHYLLHPLYLSTYHIKHVLELNKYVQWVLTLLDGLVADPTPLLQGDVHALQYWNRPLQYEPLLVHALHTPSWGDANFLKMLERGLRHARTWTVRHSEEHLKGGALDYEGMSSKLAESMWHELESHPIDNLAAERTLALDCYLTKILGTRLRVSAREAMVKWSMNVRRPGGGLEIDKWDAEHRRSTIRDAMRHGRQKMETTEKESARLHAERLPALRQTEQQFHVAEAKKAEVLETFKKMREEGREVRHVGAISLLTAKQVQLQLALRHFLDGLVVRRSGKADELMPLLEAQVAKEAEARAVAGGEEPTAEAEVARLKALGFGRKVRAAAPRAPRPRRRDRDADADADADGSGSGSESEDEDEDEEDGEDIDIDELLQHDEDVYEVEKLLDVRQASDGGREFLVKWKGYSTKDTTWEVEENILEKGMVAALLKRKGKVAPKRTKTKPATAGPAAPEPPPPEPTRKRSSRASAAVASEAARQANNEDAQIEESEEEEEEEEEAAPPPKPRATPAGSSKRQAVAPFGGGGRGRGRNGRGGRGGRGSRGKAVAKGSSKQPAKRQRVPDSSDDEPGPSSERESDSSEREGSASE